ncbi:MAG: 4-alpha-glucanotransferase [Muribaculaceae bacterium]|nr:4-alpha-glucanotransferase [Muribaculaceae bacterium]
MKLTFNVGYRTNWGESVYVTGSTALLGAGDYSKALKMKLDGIDHWSLTLDIPADSEPFEYHYIVRSDDGSVKDEWGHGNKFCAAKDTTACVMYDRWQDQPFDKPFYSSAFTDCICRHSSPGEKVLPLENFTTIAVAAPMVGPGKVLAISGVGETLGDWDPAKAMRMSDAEFPVWKVNVPSKGLFDNTEYKFLILDAHTGAVVAWEGGENRRLGVTPRRNEATIVAGMRFINTLAPWKGAGTAIPVFSLRSNEDFGVGDFFDLLKMVDWAEQTGQSFIQILPINDTTMTHTWTDSYPYNANSTFALHPMFLRVTEIGKLKDEKRRKYFEKLAAELNALPEIDYERVNDGKIEYLRELFAQDGKKTLASAAYKEFVKRNGYWLKPYAAFCSLRDRFGTPDFTKWGDYANYSADVLNRAVKDNPAEIDFVCYLQFHLDRQMRHVHEYANSKGIALKGDIPIGISRTSADAWQDPRLFNMDCQAGAPPDDFSVLGQNWGFPTYNWEEMNRDGFAWWKARFCKMSEYFDAYRIDHVLGFFRIWQIPMNALHGLLGYFNPALPFSVDELRYNYDFWIDVDLQTKPYIMDYFIEDFFGPYTAEAVKTYMTDLGNGRHALKPEFDTQRKVADYFATLPKDEKNTRICEGLLGLIDEVLFIEDPIEKGKYHPRISAQYTYIYRSLNDYERWCFNRLYNDFFYHRHNDFWYGKAMWKLPPLINSTDMLVCAEDLGMIPACVPAVMEQLEILSLEIQRMPKDPTSKFGNTWSYPYFSVCTTSTHDMGGIRLWWEENREATQQYYNQVLHESGAAPYFAEPWVCDRIIDQHLQSPSMLCILPLQDWLSIDGSLRREKPQEEQINVPANPRHYWRYRMHLTLEDLLDHNDFNTYLRDKIEHSGR